jgi:hypothetical protein
VLMPASSRPALLGPTSSWIPSSSGTPSRRECREPRASGRQRAWTTPDSCLEVGADGGSRTHNRRSTNSGGSRTAGSNRSALCSTRGGCVRSFPCVARLRLRVATRRAT